MATVPKFKPNVSAPQVKQTLEELNSAKGPTEAFMAWEKAFDALKKNITSELPGKRGVNLAPEAKFLWVQTPSGTFEKIPRGSNIPRGYTVLNKTEDDIRAMLPERPPMPAAIREQRYGRDVPIAGPAAAVTGAVGVPAAIAYQRDSLPGPTAAGRPVEAAGVTDPASGTVIIPTEFRPTATERALQLARSQQPYSAMAEGYNTPREAMMPSGAGASAETTARRAEAARQMRELPGYEGEGYTAANTFRNLPGYEGEGYTMGNTFLNLPGYEGEGVTQRAATSPSYLPIFAQRATAGGYNPAVVDLARNVVASRGSSAPTGNVPTPPPRPKEEGFFSSLFANKPMSRDELLTAYNKSMQDEGGGNAALFALLERANKEKEEGMRRGGVAQASQGAKGGGKDAALHKALEIIHHMLTTRH